MNETDDTVVIYENEIISVHELGMGKYSLRNGGFDSPTPPFITGNGSDLNKRIMELRKINPAVWDGREEIFIERVRGIAALMAGAKK